MNERQKEMKRVTIVLALVFLMLFAGGASGEAPEAAGTTAPWVCISCGTENTTSFCEGCGARKPFWICACGKENSGNRFCGNCGQGITDLVEAFNGAMAKAAEKDYAAAAGELDALGFFDSGTFETSAGTNATAADYVHRVYYSLGLWLQENGGEHEAIIDAFTKAGDYSDAPQQIEGENARWLKVFRDLGEEYLKNGEYDKAIEAFTEAGEFPGAKDRIPEAYYQKGKALLEAKDYAGAIEALEQAGDYSDSKERIREACYALGVDAKGKGDFEAAEEYLKKAGDYKDAAEIAAGIREDRKEATYSEALALLEQKEYAKARKLFKKISGYRDADEKAVEAQIGRIEKDYAGITGRKEITESNAGTLAELYGEAEAIEGNDRAGELAKQIAYALGEYYSTTSMKSSALEWFKKCGTWKDAEERATACALEILSNTLRYGSPYDAMKHYDEELQGKVSEDEIIAAEPGGSGNAVSKILEVAAALDTKAGIATGEDTYREAYVPCVRAMEEHFGMTADGKVTLKEYRQLCYALCPGCTSLSFASLLGMLADLGYISKIPADRNDREVYEKNYVNVVKKAEKALGLNADGIVTQDEYNIIRDQVEAPEKVKNLKMKVSDGKVTLTWSRVPGAVCYEVGTVDGEVPDENLFVKAWMAKKYSKDGESYGDTVKTSWTGDVIKTEVTQTYYVIAKKYTVSGEPTGVSQYIDRQYLRISAAEMNKGKYSYVGRDVRVSGLKVYNWGIRDCAGEFRNAIVDKWDAQNSEGYDVYILGRSGSSYVELIVKDYSTWKWRNGDLLDLIERITSITVRGRGGISAISWGDWKYLPSIEVKDIEWTHR